VRTGRRGGEGGEEKGGGEGRPHQTSGYATAKM